MRFLKLLTLLLLIILTACRTDPALQMPPSAKIPDPTATELVSATAVVVKKAPTTVRRTIMPTLTAKQTNSPSPTATTTQSAPSLSVSVIVPPLRCGPSTTDRNVSVFAWNDDLHITYGYAPNKAEGWHEEPVTKVQWNTIDLVSGVEKPGDALFQYDPTFWSQNNLQDYTDTTHLFGLFSPSGRYVIYPVWHGSVFDSGSKTEFWIADLQTQEKFMVGEYGYSNVYITRAAWYSYENRVIFSTTYEGPASFEIADLSTRTMFSLEKLTGEPIATETTWRLSPDGKYLAVSNFQMLTLVSLQTGETTIVEPNGGFLPRWSANGQTIYYWKTHKDWLESAEDLNTLFAYSRKTGAKHILLSYQDFHQLPQIPTKAEGCQSDLFNSFFDYEVSPDENGFLFHGDGLYLVETTGKSQSRFAGERSYRAFYEQNLVAFNYGAVMEVTAAGKHLHLRASPSLGGAILTNLRPGDQVTLIDGPVQAEGYRWWKIQVNNAQLDGWAVENRSWYRNIEVSD